VAQGLGWQRRVTPQVRKMPNQQQNVGVPSRGTKSLVVSVDDSDHRKVAAQWDITCGNAVNAFFELYKRINFM